MTKKQGQKLFNPEYIFVTVFPLHAAPDMSIPTFAEI